MNFEERKAEILRRGNARIAAKKRKKRIILGVAVPVLLVAVLAFPVSRMLGNSKGEEKAPAIQMENQSTIAPGEYPAPQATFPEIDPESGLQSCGSDALNDGPSKIGLDISYHLPPEVYLYSQEKEKIAPIMYSCSWSYEQNGQECTIDLPPAVGQAEIHTAHGYLILDASALMPKQVYGSVTGDGVASTVGIQALSVTTAEHRPNAYFSLSGNLYRIELKPGENHYSIVIDWPNGLVRYDFTVNYEE